MIEKTQPSAEHPKLTLLDNWIDVAVSRKGDNPNYSHLLINQKEKVDSAVWDELFAYINHAHEGARQALRAPLEDSLHPLQYNTDVDPAFGYPYKFGDTAQKGFFGEIIAGIVAEYYVADDEYNWKVPVYLFRTHIVAFQQLEVMKQTDDWERQIVGRTGDDGLAFARDENGRIVAWLACESKCTGEHSSTMIKNNFVKLSQAVKRPVDLLRLIDALKDYRDDEYCRNWIAALRRYWWDDLNKTPAKRCDFSMYICGTSPTRNHTWISTDEPHKEYTARRALTCAEFHIPDIDAIIRLLYGRMEST